MLSADDLKAIVERHDENQRYRDEAGPMGEAVWHLLPPTTAERMHADRGVLLDLCRDLAETIERLAREYGIDRCPLCGDPECPSPLLSTLTEAR